MSPDLTAPSSAPAAASGSVPAPASAPLLVLRPDVRALSWVFWLFSSLGFIGTLVVLLGSLEGLVVVAVAVLGGIFLLVGLRAGVRLRMRLAQKITLSDKRLEIERGLLGKRYESIELWRVKDVLLEQTLLDRMFSVGHLTVYSSDQVEPLLRLGPLRDPKVFFDRLRDFSLEARKAARVLQTAS